MNDPETLPNSETEAESGVQNICRRLRTKTSFGAFIGAARPWEEGISTTAVYWCLDTMEAAGPDDNFAHPHTCRAGRACFRPKD